MRHSGILMINDFQRAPAVCGGGVVLVLGVACPQSVVCRGPVILGICVVLDPLSNFDGTSLPIARGICGGHKIDAEGARSRQRLTPRYINVGDAPRARSIYSSQKDILLDVSTHTHKTSRSVLSEHLSLEDSLVTCHALSRLRREAGAGSARGQKPPPPYSSAAAATTKSTQDSYVCSWPNQYHWRTYLHPSVTKAPQDGDAMAVTEKHLHRRRARHTAHPAPGS